MPEEKDAYDMGLLLGEAIVNMFHVIAKIDGVTFQEAVDRWVESYIAERIILEAGDDNATTG